MKRILITLFSLMLSVIASAQVNFYFDRISRNDVSETDLSFVTNDKLYVLTYEPSNGKVVHYKNLYLYRKDTDGWKKASGLIRTDSCFSQVAVREFVPNTIHRNDNQPVFYMEDRGFGSVYKATNGSVYITFETDVWNRKEHYVYCSILVFVPNSDETYSFSYFEPKNNEYKYIADFKARKLNLEKDGLTPILTNGNETYVYRTINIGLPVLYGVNKTEYVETSDGLITINYWDANKSNPEYWTTPDEGKPYIAGTLYFNIVGSFVGDNPHAAVGSNTIEMKRIK